MNPSNLKWLKVVTPSRDYEYRWAYCPKAIKEMAEKDPIIIDTPHGLTIFPLGFKQKKASDPCAGDLILLTQYAKITHLVEVLDDKYYEKGSWFHRYVKIVGWKPEMNWQDLPRRSEILGFNVSVYDGNPHELKKLNKGKDIDSDKILKYFQ